MLTLPFTAFSGDAPTVRLSDHLRTLPTTHSIAIFIGAMARGKDDFADGIVDDKISISNYALSASVACGKVPHDFSSILALLTIARPSGMLRM